MNIKKILLTGIVALTTTFSAHADFALRNNSTNRYLSMENGASFCTCNRTVAGTWERFEFVLAGVSGDEGELIFIRSTRNGKYLRRSGNNYKVTCTTTTKDTADTRMLWSIIAPNFDYTDVRWRNESNKRYLGQTGTGANDYIEASYAGIIGFFHGSARWDLVDAY